MTEGTRKIGTRTEFAGGAAGRAFVCVCRGGGACVFLRFAGGAAGGALEKFLVRICLLRMCAKDVC